LGGFAISARVALLWQHNGNAEPSGNPPGPPHAARMPHTHATHAGEDPLTGDNMDAPAACAVPFCPYCGGVVTRARNVSEYISPYLQSIQDFVTKFTRRHSVNVKPAQQVEILHFYKTAILKINKTYLATV